MKVICVGGMIFWNGWKDEIHIDAKKFAQQIAQGCVLNRFTYPDDCVKCFAICLKSVNYSTFHVLRCLDILATAAFPVTRNTHVITKSSNVARRLCIQANGRLIGTPLFTISTWGDAVKTGYISVGKRPSFFQGPFAGGKNGQRHRKFRRIHLCITSPHLRPFFRKCSCVFPALLPRFPDRCSSCVPYAQRNLPDASGTN